MQSSVCVLRNIMIVSAILSVTPTGSESASARELILCRSAEKEPEIIVSLSSFRRFGQTFNCIKGEFVVDLSGCAPNGAYGLHAPMGSAALLGAVKRWQDYADHRGGITSNYITDAEIYFAGGFNSPESGYEEEWSFLIKRLTGEAELKQSKKVSRYRCEKKARKI